MCACVCVRVRVCVCVFVCMRERERERGEGSLKVLHTYLGYTDHRSDPYSLEMPAFVSLQKKNILGHRVLYTQHKAYSLVATTSSGSLFTVFLLRLHSQSRICQ